MRLAIVTAVWKRPEIFAMFAAGVHHLQQAFAGRLEIICCVAGSEGHTSRNMVHDKGFFYSEASNHPLSAKMNQASFLARKLSPDYCLMLGSDDIIGVNLMERYFISMQKGIDYVQLMDCYFFNIPTKQGLYWAGYQRNFNKGMGAGIGRLISARILNMINWTCWPPGYDRVLDTAFDKQLTRVRCARESIFIGKENLFALDIKSAQNMTQFDKWDNSEFIDGKKLLFDNLPEQLAKQIYGTESTPISRTMQQRPG